MDNTFFITRWWFVKAQKITSDDRPFFRIISFNVLRKVSKADLVKLAAQILCGILYQCGTGSEINEFA